MLPRNFSGSIKSVCVVLIVYAITTIWEGRGVYRFSSKRMAMHSFKCVLQLLYLKGFSSDFFINAHLLR